MNRRRGIARLAVISLLGIAVLIICLQTLLFAAEDMPASLKLTLLKVGKADAIVVQAGASTMVVDAGEEDDGEEVVAYLAKQGVKRVDVLIITHFDHDHVGGADYLVESVPVDRVILPDYEGSGAEYRSFLAALSGKKIVPERLVEPVSFLLGDAEVLVEPPASYEGAGGDDSMDNDLSLITTILHGENRLLLMGDAEKNRLRQWLSGGKATACDFIKLPHHGVYNTELEELLKATTPKYSAICSSQKNPAQRKTLELLKKLDVRNLQTKDGKITVLSDGKRLELHQKLH